MDRLGQHVISRPANRFSLLFLHTLIIPRKNVLDEDYFKVFHSRYVFLIKIIFSSGLSILIIYKAMIFKK